MTGAGAALGMHEAATGEIVPSLQARDVAAAGLGTFDDLVDLGLRPRDFLLAIAEGLPDDVRDYARARVAPDELTDDQLRSVGNHGELARRAYLAGDAAALADLPQGTDVKAMADLLAARGGDQTVWQKGAPSKTARIVGRGPRQAPDLEALALDPTTWPVVSSDVAQLVIDRRSPLSLSDRGAAMVEWCLMDATRSQLRNWAWADVCSTAKAWIERAGTPEARAEGLNCLGAALHQLGDDVAAREALESALGETASSGLLINRAWLALDDDPTAAVLDLAKAATTAVGTELVDITVLAISEHERHGPGQVPPPELVEAARKAAIARGTLDAHVTVLHFLERTDPKWLALARNTAGSPHARTWEHRVRVAAAGDLAEYISVLGKAAAAERSPSWVSGECRRLVRDAVTAAASDDIDGVYAYAVLQALLNAGIVQDPLEHAALACFAARKGLSTLEPGEENPSDELLGMLQTAQNKLRSASGAERAQRQAEVTKTIDLFALLRVAFIRSELQVAFDTYKEIVERLRASGGSRAVSQSAREAGRRIRGTVQELTRDLDAVTRLATETDVKADAREARDAAHALSEALEVFDQ